MKGRLRPEPTSHVEPGPNFQYTWRNLSQYPPDCVADVEKVLAQCRVGIFHLERSIAFVSGEATSGTQHGLVGRYIRRYAELKLTSSSIHDRMAWIVYCVS